MYVANLPVRFILSYKGSMRDIVNPPVQSSAVKKSSKASEKQADYGVQNIINQVHQ
jgi:hypothetical protein